MGKLKAGESERTRRTATSALKRRHSNDKTIIESSTRFTVMSACPVMPFTISKARIVSLFAHADTVNSPAALAERSISFGGLGDSVDAAPSK